MSNTGKTLRIAMVAGETSGDLLGAGLIRALRKHHPDLTCFGIGGTQMEAEGFVSRVPMERLAVMGLVEVLGRLPELLRIRRELIRDLLKDPPDVFIGIDAPDFNLGLEKALRAGGVRTVHYVSPSIWAWRPERVLTVKQAVARVLCLLPFEKRFYDEAGVAADFVGHPLADMVAFEPDQAGARAALGLPEHGLIVALLPGSRGSELKYLAEPFIRAARRVMQRFPDLQFVVPLVNERRQKQFEAVLNRVDPDLPVRLVSGRSREVMAAADLVLLASGTATLEAMLLKRPMVVAYKMAWLTVKLLRPKIRLTHFSLPNLLAGRGLVPELLQERCTPALLAEAMLDWLEHPERVAELRERFTEIHHQLRQDADEKAAHSVFEVLSAPPPEPAS